jgi:hypothetical protein
MAGRFDHLKTFQFCTIAVPELQQKASGMRGSREE